ncbi:MAG: DMT family transporter [Arenicellales bacterium]
MKSALLKDYLLLLFVALMWGASFSLIKVGVAEVGPASLAAGRITLAAIALLVWLVFIKHEKLDFSRSSLWQYAVIGLVGNVIPFTLVGWSEQTIDSAHTAVLMGIMPIFTVTLAHYYLNDEPISVRKLLGIGLGFIGLLVLLGFSIWQGTSLEIWSQLMILVGALCYASITIFVRRKVSMSISVLAAGAMLAASVFALILAFTLEQPLQMDWTQRAIVPMVLLGLFPTALASVLYFGLVRRMGASRFSQINYIIPVIGSVIGVVFLNEILTWRMVLALFLVLCGIFLVHSARGPADLSKSNEAQI